MSPTVSHDQFDSGMPAWTMGSVVNGSTPGRPILASSGSVGSVTRTVTSWVM